MIVYCDENPYLAAQALDDITLKYKISHAADLLIASLVINKAAYQAPWVPNAVNWRGLVAASSSSVVWYWVYDWYAHMCHEHVWRFNKPHKKGSIITQLATYAGTVPESYGEIPNCTEWQGINTVTAYRKYMVVRWNKKPTFWTSRQPPEWHNVSCTRIF